MQQTVMHKGAPLQFKMALSYVVLGAMSVVSLVPFLWLVLTSLQTSSQMFTFPPQLIPNPVEWSNYTQAWNAGGLNFARMFLNSGLIVVPVTIFTVLVSSLAAYAFARIEFTGRTVLFAVFVASLMVPTAPTLIPRFILFRDLGWLDTLWPLIVPGLFGNAFAVFLLRQFFLSLPVDLEEAAILDGATRFRIWWQIFLPLSRPALMTLAILTFDAVYNDFLGPLIYINSASKYTVQLGLATFHGFYSTEYNLLMAASVFTLVPVIIVFLLGQRYFTEGIALSGMK